MNTVPPLPPNRETALSPSLAFTKVMHRRSIAWRIVAYMILSVIFALGLVVAVGDRLIRFSLTSQEQNTLAERAALQVEQLQALRYEQLEALLDISRDRDFPATNEPGKLQAYLFSKLPAAGRFYALSLVGSNGKMIASTLPGELATNLLGAPWFEEARAGFTGVSHLQPMNVDGSRAGFYFYTPLSKDSGKSKWVLIGILLDSEVWKYIDPVRVGRGGYAYMADDHAVLIAHGARDPVTDKTSHALVFHAIGNLEYPAIVSANAESLYGQQKITQTAGIESLADFILNRPPPLDLDNPAANIHRYYFPMQDVDKTTIIAPIGAPAYPGTQVSVGPDDWVFGITISDSEFFGPLNTLRLALLVVSLLSLLLCGIFGTLAVHSITRPARQLAELANRVQAGDYSARASVNSADEIGQLAAAMNAMLDRLSEALQAQQGQIHTLKHTGLEVSRNALSLSSSAEELAAATEELNTSAEQVTQAVQHLSHDAGIQMNHVQQTAQQIHDLDQEIGRIVCLSADLLQASGQMHELAGHAEQAILQTNQLTRRVQAVLHLIEKFGRQTNMLALNATIEAARAGEMGASFVVVAEEVRRLAESSDQALKEIDELNRAIRQSVATILASVGKTGQSIVVVKNMAAELSNAATRQSQTSNGLVEVTNHLAAIAETNAASAEQIASSIEQQSSAFAQISSSSHALAVLAQNFQDLSNSLVASHQPGIERAA